MRNLLALLWGHILPENPAGPDPDPTLNYFTGSPSNIIRPKQALPETVPLFSGATLILDSSFTGTACHALVHYFREVTERRCNELTLPLYFGKGMHKHRLSITPNHPCPSLDISWFRVLEGTDRTRLCGEKNPRCLQGLHQQSNTSGDILPQQCYHVSLSQAQRGSDPPFMCTLTISRCEDGTHILAIRCAEGPLPSPGLSITLAQDEG